MWTSPVYMGLFLNLVALAFAFFTPGQAIAGKCPCSNPKWCEQITDTTRKEVFAFSLYNNVNHWRLFDWTKVTTVVMFGYINPELMCLAHSHGARVAALASVKNTTFLSPQSRKTWISKQLEKAKLNFLDGLNFDYESVIQESDNVARTGYTLLVNETNQAFKKELPYFQVTVDVAWKPNIDVRYYDYVGLADSSDFLFVMAYDEQSQIFGECVALPNSGYPSAYEGLDIYLSQLQKSIAPNKLVLGVPWYGYKYPCIKKELNKCSIKEVPFRGVNCSDAAGTQVAYPQIIKMPESKQTQWNGTSATPFFSYEDSDGQWYQVHYDNPFSLRLKYQLAVDLDLRGVGMWNIDYLDYSDTPEGRDMRRLMFGVLPGGGNYSTSPPRAWVATARSRAPSTTSSNLGRSSASPTCPCSDPKLCEPIKDMNRKEVFAFSNENNETHWRGFDWSKITTVVMFNYLNTSLMCLAHSHGVRAVVLGAIEELIVITPTLRKLWVKEQAQIVQTNFLDGLNFDYEHTMLPPEHHYQDAFTELVRETVAGLRAIQPYAQVSVCTVVDASSPVMAYDYPAIAEAADFLFIMAYDESGTLHNGPNSGYHITQAGVESFLKKKIPPSKLVMGLPWYGDVYQCVSLKGDDCVVEPTGKGFGQWSYVHINKVLKTVPHNYRWNASSLTPYFSFKDPKTNLSHLVEYDDPRSLALKYNLAVKMGIRGVGMFLVDGLDYSDTEAGQAMRKAMFDPLPSWNNSSVKAHSKDDKIHADFQNQDKWVSSTRVEPDHPVSLENKFLSSSMLKKSLHLPRRDSSRAKSPQSILRFAVERGSNSNNENESNWLRFVEEKRLQNTADTI